MTMLNEATLIKIRQSRARRLIVGFSGGMDSHVLLHALVRSEVSIPIHALHVNHGLSPRADAWQQHCAAICTGLGIEFTAINVQVDAGSGMEARARDARYGAFARFLEPRDLLLLAHHADDQIETVLLTLLRGGNRPGVSGMPAERAIGKARLQRPLLDIERRVIERYAVQQNLSWIEDQSNKDTGMNRNYLRHRVLPAIRERWPDMAKTLRKKLTRDDEFFQLLDDIGSNDIVAISAGRGAISVIGLAALDSARRKNVVRYWAASFNLPLPGDGALSGLSLMLNAADGAAPLINWLSVCLRRFGEVIFLTSELVAFDASIRFSFDDRPVIETGAGKLTVSHVKGRGVVLGDLHEVSVRFRCGGERIRVGRNRTLKNIFQAAGVPVWLRDRLPLIFQGEELVAIAGLPAFDVAMCVASASEAQPTETGVQFLFEAPGQPYSH